MFRSLIHRLGVFLVIGALGFAVWWAVTVWSECRDHGHSIMYCLTLLDGGL